MLISVKTKGETQQIKGDVIRSESFDLIAIYKISEHLDMSKAYGWGVICEEILY